MHSIPASFQTLQKIFLGLGTAGLAISCLMTAKFGWSMSWLHALALCSVTIMAAFIFPAKRFLHDAGHITAARWIMIFGVFFVSLEFFSDLGYTIGMRDQSVQTASVQTVAYDNAQDVLKGNKTNVAMWKRQLAELKTQNAWVASVTADSLRAKVAIADKAIKDEAARGGCGPICNKRMAEKAALEEKIAKAEKVEDLDKRIAATQRIIDKATEVASNTHIGFSPVKAQTDFVAQLWNIGTGVEAEQALNPNAVQLTVTQILIGFFIALGATFLPTTAFYLAFFGKKIGEFEEQPATAVAAKSAIAASPAREPLVRAEAQHVPALNGSRSNHLIISDESGMAKVRQWIAEAADNSFGRLAT